MTIKIYCEDLRTNSYSSLEYKAWLKSDDNIEGLQEVLRSYKNRVAKLNNALTDDKPYDNLTDFYFLSFATEQDALAFQLRGLKVPKE